MSTVGSDLRYAIRRFRQSPGFSLVGVATLAVGICSTTVLFSAVDAVLLRTLPVPEPGQLVVVAPPTDESIYGRRFPFGFYEALTSADSGLEAALAMVTFPSALTWPEGGTRIAAGLVTANYFEVLGLVPERGRFFSRSDTIGAVISHGTWREQFSGRTDILGTEIRVGPQVFEVIGVTPPTFVGLNSGLPLDIWLPIQTLSAVTGLAPDGLDTTHVSVVARVADSASLEEATTRSSGIYRRWLEDTGQDADADLTTVRLVPASSGLANAFRTSFTGALWWLLGTGVCLWLIATANIAGLSVARFRTRSREVGVRLALGATRFMLLRQLLAESVVLAVLGAGVGVLLSYVVVQAIPAFLPSWADVGMRLSLRAVTVAAVASALAAVLIATVQALLVDRRRVLSYLAQRMWQGHAHGQTFSRVLVVAQVTVTLPLVVAAALLAQSLSNLNTAPLGFLRTNLLEVEVEPVGVGYSTTQADAYYASLIEQLRLVPGVENATLSSGGTISNFGGALLVQTTTDVEAVGTVTVGDEYFRTMGVAVLGGRVFGAEDGPGGPEVAVVNRALAQRLEGGVLSAVGRPLVVSGRDAPLTIVGVVDNTAWVDLRDTSQPIAYLPESQVESSYLLVYVRTAGEPGAMAGAVRATARSVDANIPVLSIETITSRREVVTQREQLLAVASSIVGSLALLLSALGLFGLLAYTVTSRTREIGIRSALGARHGHIAGLILREAGLLVGIGCALGSGSAAVLSRLIQSQLFGVAVTDPASYGTAAGLLILCALFAAGLPIRRALRLDPNAALRTE